MNMCPTNKCKPPPELCLKGQVFFIYTNIQSLESVKDRISLLGGKVDPFLSRDVTAVLVEDNHLVGPQLLSPDLTIKSAYASNGAVVTSFPYSNSLYSIPSTSRGYNFIATNTSNSPYRVICYARQWGISVYGIGQFLTWIEPQVKTATTRQKKKASENVSNLSGFFIKFESLLKNYRPCYKMFNNDPSRLLPLKNANIFVKTEACNVILDKPVGSRQLHLSHMDTTDRPTHQGKGANFPVKANDKKPPNNKVKPKEESNYCECCRVHFSDLKQHIKSSRHQSFVSNEKNYESVHNILKMLPTPQEFIEKLQNPSPSADSVLANGDKSLTIQSANMPETDYSVPLNLQMRKETATAFTMPLDLHIEKTNIISVTPSLIKEEPAPLDLHIKKDYEVSIETKDKQETNLLVDFQQIDSYKKEDTNNIQSKIEMLKDSVVESININDKQPIETPDEIQCDELNGDSLLDRTNTAALAQLCLKNFDSYWLDTIPCEVDDMVFDDIFDIDDGKGKLDNECLEPFGENFITSDIAQTAGLVSINSTPNLKLETNEDQPGLMSNILDVKDDNTEVYNSQSIIPNKLEKDCEASLSPQNAPSYQGSVLQGKKQIFSIASFCSDKISIEATPSCSNAVPPSKQQELLFSSESSDDENGNVLISNALNMITNSDSEAKADKESSEENSIQEQPEQKYTPVTSCSTSEVKPDKIFSDNVTKDNEITDQMNSVPAKNENPPLVQNPADEIKMDIYNCKENEIQPVIMEETKIDIQSFEKNLKISDLASKDIKITSTFNKESYVSHRKSSISDINSEMSVDNLVPSKRICSEEVNIYKLNLPTDNEILSGKVKTDPDSYKENTAERKMREISSNEIHRQNSTPINGMIDDAKQIKVSYEEMPVSIQNFCINEPVNLDTKDRYLIPKKKAYYEMKKNQNSLESNFSSRKAVPCENKVDQTSYFTSVKTFVTKEEKPPERIKDHPVLVEKCYINKRNIKKDILKEEYPTYSANPCQYSYKKDKCDANISSNALPVQSSVRELSVKIPHKKKSSKLRKLPPLWSVSVLPGSGVKLKFTCLHPNKKDTLHSGNRG